MAFWVHRLYRYLVSMDTHVLYLQLYLKKNLLHSCFPMNFEKFLSTTFLKENLWLLLKGYLNAFY